MAVRHCRDYGAVAQAVDQLLDAVHARSLVAGERVLLKVNLMRGSAPAQARTTHPAVVRAVLRWVRAAGGDPFVAESSGVLGFTGEVAEAAGVAQLCRDEGADFVNLDAGPFRRVQSGGRVLGDLLLPEAVLDAPVRITLPKLKTHTLTGLTCALKNQVGILPGGTKCAIHRVAGSPERLAQAVVDIAMAAPFHLGVVDAVVGLEGGGSAAGRPVAAGFVAGGRDLVALDACCGRLVGFEPREVPTTVAAAARGLGEARVGAVALDGIGDLEPLVRFARPGFDPKRLAPIGRLAYRLRERIVAPTVDRHRCQRCGECARVCPVDGIELAPGPRIGDGCVHCFACSERCPSGAMMLATPLYARRSLRQRTRGLPLARLARTGRRWRR